MNSVIKVQNLSKRYHLGLKEKQAETLVGQISQAIRSPLENLKRLRQMSRFGQEDDSVFWALKDINFEVKEGEVLGIIGKNGAGKSTLLKILSQITEPTSGKIEIHGRVASLLEIGTGFHPELSGRENIYMNGTILGMTRREIDSKLDDIIDFSGVEKFIDTPVKFYSSGMKVRLGFSVAAHLDPEILIIDEVLAVGDYEFQKKCLGKMEDVSKNQGRTVLFVSHDLNAVLSLCPKTILLRNGEIVLTGNSNDVLNYYKDQSNLFSTKSEFRYSDSLIQSELLISNVIINKEILIDTFFNHSRGQKLEIEIEGETKKTLDCLITLAIFRNGLRLVSFFDQEEYGLITGVFRSSFLIDTGNLKLGRYNLGIGAQLSNGQWIWNESFTSFDLIDSKLDINDKHATGVINFNNFVESKRLSS